VSGKTALVFGVSGQDGIYLTELLLERGYAVHGASRNPDVARDGALGRLGLASRIALHKADPSVFTDVERLIAGIAPTHIVNLAAQSSVGLSFQQPAESIGSIVAGTLNILEAMRLLRSTARFVDAGSGDCFGSTNGLRADETFAFQPSSPYAVGKAAACWAVRSYRTAHKLSACSALLFSHESPLRPDRFVTRKIVRAAAAIAAGRESRLRLGTLDAIRDWGWAPEYAEAMARMLELDACEDIVLATGVPYSLRDFVGRAFACFGLDWRDHVVSDPSLMRPSDLAFSAGDPGKAARLLGWTASLHMPQVVERLALAERQRQNQA
jgi:GDPmannose 4,6-dehydratase